MSIIMGVNSKAHFYELRTDYHTVTLLPDSCVNVSRVVDT